MKKYFVLALVVVPTLLALGFLSRWQPAQAQQTAVQSPSAQARFSPEIQRDIDALIRASKARAAIVRRVSPSVVHISVEKRVTGNSHGQQPDMFEDEFFRRFFQPRLPNPREFKQRGLGSGFVVDARGYILTNNHVVGEADKILVKTQDGTEMEAKLIGTDPATDLAVIQVAASNLPVAVLGNSEVLEVGESVLAIGNPFGLEQTITAGIVSAIGRSSVGVTDYEDFIQTDASINPGNSGGPLVDLRGEVVGVNTAIFSRSGGNMGIGFAIPMRMARSIMTALIDSGKVERGFLGVVIQDVSKDIAGALGVSPHSGVLVANVGDDTPAGRSGIKAGDIIVEFNHRKVRSVNELRNVVAAIKPGSSVPTALIREGQALTLPVTVGLQPEDMGSAIRGEEKESGKAPEQPVASEESLGMKIQPLTPALAERLGYRGFSGVVVTAVAPDSPAGEAGVREGTLLMEANREPIGSLEDLRGVLNQTPSGQFVLFLARVGKFNRFVAIKKP